MQRSPLQESAAALVREIDAFLRARDAGAPTFEEPYLRSDLDGQPLEDLRPTWNYEFETLKQFRALFEARIDAIHEKYSANRGRNMYFEEGVRLLKDGVPVKTQELYVFPAQLQLIAST